MGFNRLPGKVLKKVGNKTLLEIHLSRALQSGLASESIIMPVNWPK
jgi:spore coat polysaccharide biosynthesis protein SpsF